jgi:serine protease Do
MTEPILPSSETSSAPASTLAAPPADKARSSLSPVFTLLLGGVLACLLVLLGYGMGAKNSGGLPLQHSSGDSSAIERTVQLVGPAVMNVDTELGKSKSDVFLPNPGEGDEPRQGKGTGVVIDSARGLMLTNAHVVSDPDSGATAKKITATSRDGKKYTGKVVGKDRQSDIAVVKLEAKNLPQAKLADFKDAKELAIGQWLVAIGNPYGQANTVTVGVLSAVGREIPVPGERGGPPFKLKDLIQTDTAINPGNSGGPICNLNGEVIAINTAIIPYATGIGFCIPINKAKDIADQLIKTGKISHPYIGVFLKPITSALQTDFGMPDKTGAFVQQVMPNSPASKSGLKLADVIKKLDGQTMNDDKAVTDFLASKKVGDVIKVEYRRNNTLRKTTTLKIAERPENG